MLPVILGIISALKGMQDKKKEGAQAEGSPPAMPATAGTPQTPPVLQGGGGGQPGQIDPQMQAQIDALRKPQSPDFSHGPYSGVGGY